VVQLAEGHHPETHLIPLVLRGALGSEPLKVFGGDYDTPDGTCTRDYIHVQDLARAHVRAVERLGKGWAGEPLNLGCGREYSVLEVIRAAERVTSLSIPYQVQPRRPGDVPRLVADNHRAEAALGWRPEWTDLEKMVGSAWKWMLAHPQGYQGLWSAIASVSDPFRASQGADWPLRRVSASCTASRSRRGIPSSP